MKLPNYRTPQPGAARLVWRLHNREITGPDIGEGGGEVVEATGGAEGVHSMKGAGGRAAPFHSDLRSWRP